MSTKQLTDEERLAAFEKTFDEGRVTKFERAELAPLEQAVRDRHTAEERIRQEVRHLRAKGATWGLIAFCLDISRQAATKRFKEIA